MLKLLPKMFLLRLDLILKLLKAHLLLNRQFWTPESMLWNVTFLYCRFSAHRFRVRHCMPSGSSLKNDLPSGVLNFHLIGKVINFRFYAHWKNEEFEFFHFVRVLFFQFQFHFYFYFCLARYLHNLNERLARHVSVWQNQFAAISQTFKLVFPATLAQVHFPSDSKHSTKTTTSTMSAGPLKALVSCAIFMHNLCVKWVFHMLESWWLEKRSKTNLL